MSILLFLTLLSLSFICGIIFEHKIKIETLYTNHCPKCGHQNTLQLIYRSLSEGKHEDGYKCNHCGYNLIKEEIV